MCRWFAYISSSEPCLLEDVLIRPDHSIVKQVEEHYLPDLFPKGTPEEDEANERESTIRNKYFNNDGTGIAHYNKTRREYGMAKIRMPQVYKTMMAPTNDINFTSLCENTTSRTVFAHVRKATSEVQQYNSHPFVFGRHVFMHNGSIAKFDLIRRALCAKLSPDAYKNVKGTTDSEHLAALYITNLCPNKDDWTKQYSLEKMSDSLKLAIAQVHQLQREALGPSLQELPGSSLNLCTTDGEQLLACRYRNSAEEQPPSLYYSIKAGVKLNRKYPGHPNFETMEVPAKDAKGLTGTDELPADDLIGKHIIIASEPTTKTSSELKTMEAFPTEDPENNDWVLIKKNKLVLVDFEGKKTRIRFKDF